MHPAAARLRAAAQQPRSCLSEAAAAGTADERRVRVQLRREALGDGINHAAGRRGQRAHNPFIAPHRGGRRLAACARPRRLVRRGRQRGGPAGWFVGDKWAQVLSMRACRKGCAGCWRGRQAAPGGPSAAHPAHLQGPMPAAWSRSFRVMIPRQRQCQSTTHRWRSDWERNRWCTRSAGVLGRTAVGSNGQAAGEDRAP